MTIHPATHARSAHESHQQTRSVSYTSSTRQTTCDDGSSSCSNSPDTTPRRTIIPFAVPTNSEPLLALSEVTPPISGVGLHSGPLNENMVSSLGPLPPSLFRRITGNPAAALCLLLTAPPPALAWRARNGTIQIVLQNLLILIAGAKLTHHSLLWAFPPACASSAFKSRKRALKNEARTTISQRQKWVRNELKC